MKKENSTIEEKVELQGFINETFNVICSDGFATATSDIDSTKVINLIYPKIEDLNDAEVFGILEYRGLSKNSEINFGDVMMRYGVQESHSYRP